MEVQEEHMEVHEDAVYQMIGASQLPYIASFFLHPMIPRALMKSEESQ